MTTQFLQFSLLVSLFAPFAAHSQSEDFSMDSKPVWELGIVGGYFSSFDYPGSKDPNTAQIIAPFFIYRSEIFRFGDGGFGAVAIEEPRVKLDVSIGGALKANSEPGSVREGLPVLDLLFELGPRLQIKLFEKQWDTESRSRLDWDSKIRAVVSTDFKGAQAQGFVFSTGLAYRQRAIAGDKIDFIVNADITFGDERYNDNFYTVSPEFVTPQRESYKAKAGYVESRVFFGLAIRPSRSFSTFIGLGLFNYANSANESSPLFETNTSTQYVLGFAWTPLKSERLIEVFGSE